MYQTEGNLQAAFAGESQAFIRYTLFAAKSEADGLPELAKLFRAATDAEFVHARNHFNTMGGVGSARDNLLAAATGEHYEMTRIYPGFIDKAMEEQNENARITFEYACAAEKVHNEHFEKALQTTKAGQRIPAEAYFICQVCGNLVTKDIPPRCGVCSNSSDKFKQIQ